MFFLLLLCLERRQQLVLLRALLQRGLFQHTLSHLRPDKLLFVQSSLSAESTRVEGRDNFVEAASSVCKGLSFLLFFSVLLELRLEMVFEVFLLVFEQVNHCLTLTELKFFAEILLVH